MIVYTASQALSYEQVDKALYMLSTKSRPAIDFGYEAMHLINLPEVKEAVTRLIADEKYSAYVPVELNSETVTPYWRIVRIVNHNTNEAA